MGQSWPASLVVSHFSGLSVTWLSVWSSGKLLVLYSKTVVNLYFEALLNACVQNDFCTSHFLILQSHKN